MYETKPPVTSTSPKILKVRVVYILVLKFHENFSLCCLFDLHLELQFGYNLESGHYFLSTSELSGSYNSTNNEYYNLNATFPPTHRTFCFNNLSPASILSTIIDQTIVQY